MDVVLRGYSGYNTRWALKVMERVFPAELDGGVGRSPAAVTVFFGANDACLPDRCSGFQHVPVDEYKQNLRSIVYFLRVSHSPLSLSLHSRHEQVLVCLPFSTAPVQKRERDVNVIGCTNDTPCFSTVSEFNFN